MIGARLGCAHTTASREVARNGGRVEHLAEAAAAVALAKDAKLAAVPSARG